MNKKLTLLITSLLFSSFVLSESVNSFCADLVRENQENKDPCGKYLVTDWEGYSGCSATYSALGTKKWRNEYLGIYDFHTPSVKEQFSHCVDMKIRESISEQQDKDFLKYLNKY
jgi:hypothetical protein